MVRFKRAFRVIKPIAVALVVLGVALSAVSCGSKGKVYGDLVWYYLLIYAPYPGLFANPGNGTVYQISEGTYNYKYQIYDGYNYYPSYYTAWAGTYTVTAEPGGFPFTNGADDYFQLYAAYYGMVKSGSGVSSIAPPANGSALPTVTPKLGTQTWTENGLRITVTTQIVNLSDQDRASLKQAVHK